ncbi:hypothetical protein NJC38_02840 [Pseudomonas sp. 21LCFQ010]|uniref:hypothetical protein n=1 Tax=Pseudomonas sp. 21LCFQ010 TaxID=2957506 RepID=UPI0020979E2E|nr:hypothetical protein [Pseudomonas sp. 21LCFQ010]MCO8161088.1 hypothetical protein [Pseudomonas sp. 21LCFQ010]
MNSDLIEEEMRLALFGTTTPAAPSFTPALQDPATDAVFTRQAVAPAKKKVAKAFTPRLRVTLRVGNEFEGKTFELIHESNTLSKLLAEQESVKAARKKFRYIEVISVESM